MTSMSLLAGRTVTPQLFSQPQGCYDLVRYHGDVEILDCTSCGHFLFIAGVEIPDCTSCGHFFIAGIDCFV